MRIAAKVFLAVLMLTMSTVSLAQESSVVIKQQGSPIEISSYKAQFQREVRAGTYTRGQPDQILHSMTCKNVADKDIVAVQIGFASFDAFNELMGRFNGLALQRINIGKAQAVNWEQRPYAAFAFEGYGTGVAFVNAVRFADGTIWRANQAELLLELQKFEKDLKLEDLEVPKK